MILSTRQLLLNLLLRTVPSGWTRPGAQDSLEFALYSTMPADDGTGGVECSGGGYAPVALGAADANVSLSGDVASNVSSVQFPAGATPLTASISVAGWVLRRTSGLILFAQPAAGLPQFVTADAGTDKFTRTAHGLVDQQPVRFVALDSTVPLPTGISAGTTYYVVSSTANDFKVSATVGGSAIDITTNGACAVRKYYGGTYDINQRAVIPAGEFKFQIAAPLR